MGTEAGGFPPEQELDLGLTPEMRAVLAAVAADREDMITVARSDLRAVLAAAYDLAGHCPEFGRLAGAAGLVTP